MKRNFAIAVLAFFVFGILYELSFFDYFFLDDGYTALKGIALICVIFFLIATSIHKLLDHWIEYEQEVEFIIEKKKIIPREMNMVDGNPGSGIYINTYYLIFSRKDSPEEKFEKEVRKNVFDAFTEGDIVKVDKKRTIVDTHYKVIKEKDIPKELVI
jgi:hypothetical protein